MVHYIINDASQPASQGSVMGETPPGSFMEAFRRNKIKFTITSG